LTLGVLNMGIMNFGCFETGWVFLIQNEGVIRHQPLLYTLVYCTGIFQPIVTYKPIFDLHNKQFHINEVNIQDGDLTFIYPSV
jgi:hypothetical protein